MRAIFVFEIHASEKEKIKKLRKFLSCLFIQGKI